MSRWGPSDPPNNAKHCDTTQPTKTCPVCDTEVQYLPHHIATEHNA